MTKLQQDFIKVLSHSQGIPEREFNVNKLFRLWEEGKKYFIEQMGGELIYTYPEKVTFHLDEETRYNRVEEFIDWLKNNFIWMLVKDADLGALTEFVSIHRKDFFVNSLSKEFKTKVYINHCYSNPKEVTIPKGMKITKAFKFFIEDKDLLTEIQNRASMILQEDKIDGYLCFSVHPLDYLSISLNNMNWRSCHALDGDFRAGNLNYMTDNCTAIVYLRSDKPDAEIPCFGPEVPWNDKKWRVLLFFSNEREMVFAGRQYPFEATCGLDPWVKKLLEKLFPPYLKDYQPTHWDEWTDLSLDAIKLERDTIQFKSPYYVLNRRQGLVALNELIHYNRYKVFYDDLQESSVYTKPYHIEKITSDGQFLERQTEFYIGHNAPCPICNTDYITSSEWMVCDGCVERLRLDKYNDVESLYSYCTSCGKIHLREDLYYISPDTIICEECLNKYYSQCTCCGLDCLSSELTYKEDGVKLCPWCLQDLKEAENNGKGQCGETNNCGQVEKIVW